LTIYLDTSVLVAALTNEADTARVQASLAARTEGECAISDWVVTEFSSALSIKVCSGQIGLPDRAAALALFHRLIAENLSVLPVERAHFHAAARHADQYALGLRAGDSLHLAICAQHGATLYTLDRRLAEAGPALGVPTALL
jgi:uncharacterized protein